MGEEQQNVMGTLGSPGFVVLLFFVCVFVVASVNWQPCVYYEYKATSQLISNKRRYSGKALNGRGAPSPVQQRFSLSGGEAKARKGAQRRVPPKSLYASGQQ